MGGASRDSTGLGALEERMDEAESRGRDYFRQGLNCSECVLRTFMDMHETFPWYLEFS